jgi:hypothetical protein
MSHVYRCYGADDRLLYVGCARNVAARMSQHRATTWWAWMVVRVDADEYPSEQEARAAERKAIAAERPRFNIQGRWQGRPGWTADEYRDFYDASRLGPNHYTGQTQRRLERVRRECLTRYGIDLEETA